MLADTRIVDLHGEPALLDARHEEADDLRAIGGTEAGHGPGDGGVAHAGHRIVGRRAQHDGQLFGALGGWRVVNFGEQARALRHGENGRFPTRSDDLPKGKDGGVALGPHLHDEAPVPIRSLCLSIRRGKVSAENGPWSELGGREFRHVGGARQYP